jgi:hypothetical protein
VEERPAIPYVGIRVTTPFRGMLAVRDRLLAEARAGIKEAEIETVGYGFLRLHVIDMGGPMDLEAGIFTAGPAHIVHPKLRSGSMPAGRYVTMKYRDHAHRANQALQDWRETTAWCSNVGVSPRVMNLRVAMKLSGPTRRSNRARRGGRLNCRSFWPDRMRPSHLTINQNAIPSVRGPEQQICYQALANRSDHWTTQDR